VRSLALQGGLMSEEECAQFELEPYSSDALKLRVWDDLAKKASWFEVSRDEAFEQLNALMDAVVSLNHSLVERRA
jgi:predicted HD phosphohydrolase